jgi:hypothetical protein
VFKIYPPRNSICQVAILATVTLGVKVQYQDKHLLFIGHTISGPGTFTSQSLRLSGSRHEAHTSLFLPHKQHLSHISETKAKRISQPLGNHVCRIAKPLRLRCLLVLSAGGKTKVVQESRCVKKWKDIKKERKEERQTKTGEWNTNLWNWGSHNGDYEELCFLRLITPDVSWKSKDGSEEYITSVFG